MMLRIDHGWTQDQLARRYFITQSAVSRIIKRNTTKKVARANRAIHCRHLTRSAHRKLSAADRTRMAELYYIEGGWSHARLAERYGLSPAGVAWILKQTRRAK